MNQLSPHKKTHKSQKITKPKIDTFFIKSYHLFDTFFGYYFNLLQQSGYSETFDLTTKRVNEALISYNHFMTSYLQVKLKTYILIYNTGLVYSLTNTCGLICGFITCPYTHIL